MKTVELKESIELTNYTSSIQGKQLMFNKVYENLDTNSKVAIGESIRATVRPTNGEFDLEIVNKTGRLYKGNISGADYAAITDTQSAIDAFIKKYLS